MKKTLLLTLLTYSLVAMEQKVLPVEVPICKDEVWLVHQTRLLPKNGCMVAGGVVRVGTPTSNFYQLPLDQVNELATRTITAWRNTLHWSVNSLVYPHDMKEEEAFKTIEGVNERTDSLYATRVQF